MTSAPDDPTVHASCVRVGDAGVLIRGPSGSGKSRLAFALILAGRTGAIPPTVLVADDRVRIAVRGDVLIGSPPEEIAGLLEVRGVGIRRLPHVEEATIRLVVDLDAPDGARLPEPEAGHTALRGVIVPRLPLLAGVDPLLAVIAALTTQDGLS